MIFSLIYEIVWILSKNLKHVNLALFIDIALLAEPNFTFRWLFLSIYFFLTVMERLIYRYGETNLCYGVIFKLKFLSDPSTKVYNI